MTILRDASALFDKVNIIVIGISDTPEPTESNPFTPGLEDMLEAEAYQEEVGISLLYSSILRCLPRLEL